MFTPEMAGMCLGAVVGWLAHRVSADARVITAFRLSALLGVILGGTVTGVFVPSPDNKLFIGYCIGVAMGFFGRVVLVWVGAQSKVPPA